MTAGEIWLTVLFYYLVVGVFWLLMNFESRLARYDRAEWRRKGQYARFVWVPVVVVLCWPLAAWLSWKIKKAIESGEFDRIAREVMKEHQDKERGS